MLKLCSAKTNKYQTVQHLTIAEVTLYAHLLETLCYFVRNHPGRTKFLLVQENIAAPIAKLLASPEKSLKLSALKFFRHCIGLHDAFYSERLLKVGVFDGILDIVYETMPRDNLLNSACLELFELIKRENMKDLTIHLVERYRERLKGITYVETFKQLMDKYEKYVNPPMETLSFTSVETEPNRVMIPGGQSWRQQGLKEQDAEEEAYFNGTIEDDEERFDEIATVQPMPLKVSPRGALTNGASAHGKPLVDYPDEDDDDGTMDVLAQEPDENNLGELNEKAAASETSTAVSTPSSDAASLNVSSPPESITEKRKREDDEEDELSRIAASGTKRRSSSVGSVASANSASSNGGTAHTHHHALRRKKSSIQTEKASAGKQKISIALAVKSNGGSGEGE